MGARNVVPLDVAGYVVKKPLGQFISVLGREPKDEEATIMGYACVDLVGYWRRGLGTYKPHDEICFLYFA